AAEKILSAVQGTDFSVSELIGNEFICARFELLKPENYKRLQTAGGDYTAEMTAEIARQKEDNGKQLEAFTEETDRLFDSNREQLEQLYLRLYAMQRVYDVCRGRGEVSGLFFISGWIPSDSVDEIKAEIEHCAASTSILLDDTKELNVAAPVLLKNKRIFRAFQDIVALYSLPSYDEFDPSAFVALTFALFFGFMFGDVGHGFLIYLAAVWAQKKALAPRSTAFIMKCAAASSMFFGVLYGSIFGQEDIIPALWLSPIKETNSLIATSIAVGFAIISAGMLLNIARQFKDRNFGSMLFDGQGIAGLTFYWSVAAFALARITNAGSGTLLFALKLTAAISVMLIAFKSTLARILFKEKTKSSAVTDVFGIIEVVLSMLSNTVSFVRLAAFAL
ncbi:MAG: V-type ATPase 116kDa subunit family protein, partial [Synergistaceae bacterium]|nr:V-type ATPase 116kDa subunit family protein [Synergistaceae bacterium]